jgi:hypothetical protein
VLFNSDLAILGVVYGYMYFLTHVRPVGSSNLKLNVLTPFLNYCRR